jgi:hypothetical protein
MAKEEAAVEAPVARRRDGREDVRAKRDAL